MFLVFLKVVMKKGYKECPFCKNEIKKEAIKCMYCKEMLSGDVPIEKHPDTKICPFCKNEIKFDAIKCQYCHEMLDSNVDEKQNWSTKKIVKKPQIEKLKKNKSEDTLYDWISDEIKPNRWSRFLAWLIDVFVFITLIWWIINLIWVFTKWTTIWLRIVWIRLISLSSDKLTFKQKFLRFISYFPFWYSLMVIVAIPLMIFWGDKIFETIIYSIMWFLFLLNIVELFFSTPTFIDKWLKIAKIKYKWTTTWAVLLVIILFFILAKILWWYQNYLQNWQVFDSKKNAKIKLYDSILNESGATADDYKQYVNTMKSSNSQYQELYSEMSDVMNSYMNTISSVWTLQIHDYSQIKNTKLINEIISNREVYKTANTDYLDNISKLFDKYNLDSQNDDWPYWYNATMNNERKLAAAMSDWADFNIERYKFFLTITNDIMVDENWDVFFYEDWYKMNKFNEYVEKQYVEYDKFEKIANECEAFTKSRAEYKKNNL